MIAYPSSWFLYGADIPNVGVPYALVVSSSEFVPLPNPGADPDLRAPASDLTMVLLDVGEPARISSITLPTTSHAIALDGRKIRFDDLAEAPIDRRGFRRLSGWYVADHGRRALRHASHGGNRARRGRRVPARASDRRQHPHRVIAVRHWS